MRSDTQRDKGLSAFTSKPILPEEPQIRVTVKSSVTFIAAEKPAKCNVHLQPWLWLGNLAADAGGPWRRKDDLLIEPRYASEEELETGAALVRAGIRDWQELSEIADLVEVPSLRFGADFTRADEWVYGLVHFVAATFGFYTGHSGVRAIEMPSSPVLLEERDGQVRIIVENPIAAFVDALNRAESARIGRCPICARFFYASRQAGSYGTKTCSKKCNQVRKQREYRKRQSHYEQNRKFKLAGIKPEGARR